MLESTLYTAIAGKKVDTEREYDSVYKVGL
jgi:hypothetical protein